MSNKAIVLGAALATALTSSVATAGLSGNLGVVSDYFFRGVLQSSGASANGGVDYEAGAISAGIWAADVGNAAGAAGGTSFNADGVEYDIYGAYSGEAGDIGYSVGATLYLYTGDFDTSYQEINLGATYKEFGIDFATGTREEITPGVSDQDYSIINLNASFAGIDATYGIWGGDFSGNYLELSHTIDIGGADATISVINGDADTDAKNLVSDGTSIIFGLSKSFDIK